MANEIQIAGPGTGKTLYAKVTNQTSGFPWSTTSGYFGAFISGNFADYAVQMVEQGVSNIYLGNFPQAIGPGVYSVEVRSQQGGGPLQTDPVVGGGDLQWQGSRVFPLSDIPVSGLVSLVRPARGVMIQNFGIYFKSAADHVTPLTSGVVSGQIARDGGSFGLLQSGAFTEVGLGWYNLQALTSGDLLANVAKLHFSAVGVSGGAADPVNLEMILQRSSGQ